MVPAKVSAVIYPRDNPLGDFVGSADPALDLWRVRQTGGAAAAAFADPACARWQLGHDFGARLGAHL